MIKPYYEITIRDYNIMERTGNISQFKAWYNILPVKLFVKVIRGRIKTLSEFLNISEDDKEKNNKIWKLQSLLKINLVESSYYGILNILELGNTVNSFKQNMSKSQWNKIKISNTNLPKYIKYINDFTGIEIKEITDLKMVLDELMFRKDKFNENFNKKEPIQDDKIYLMSVALGVFSYLNQTLDINMTVVEFAAIREDALTKMRKEKSK